jgi:cytochrome c551/c552
MNRKNILAIIFSSCMFFFSCGGNESKTEEVTDGGTSSTEAPAAEPASDKGIGKFQNVELTHPLDEDMVKKGQSIAEVKCMSCHKLTEEKLVGPGWKGVTDRRQPEWIMNFVTNVDEMLEKDPNAQAMLEVCMVRMPNQNLADDEARAVLEFMRKNDGKN